MLRQILAAVAIVAALAVGTPRTTFAASGSFSQWYDFNEGGVQMSGSYTWDGSTVSNPSPGWCTRNYDELNWTDNMPLPASYFWDNSQHTEVTFYCNVTFYHGSTQVTCYPRMDVWYNNTQYAYVGTQNC
jgi:hypothetical protein